MTEIIRIQKYIAASGAGSRRDAERLIAQGRVLINGEPANFGDIVTLGADTVMVDGKQVSVDHSIYILLNKPRDVVSSIGDSAGRHTIADCLEGLETRVFPAGRLPMAVEGALLLTNDGDLVLELNQPDRQLEMTYLASVEGIMSDDVVKRLADGIVLDGARPVRARVLILNTGLRTTLVRVVLLESRAGRVNRLLAHVGYPPYELRRVAIANLHIGDLEPGQWRYVETDEIERFRQALHE